MSVVARSSDRPGEPLLGPGETVEVARLKAGAECLGLDVPTSAVFWLSELAWAVLDGRAPAPTTRQTGLDEAAGVADEAAGAVAQVAALLARGDITRLERETNLPPSPEATDQPVTALSLGISTECNLRCRYCFGRDHGGPDDVLYRAPRGHMTREVALAAVNFLFERSQGTPDLILNFFGGEPLLNDETVETAATAALDRAEQAGRRVVFAMTTNGTLLDERRVDILGRLGIRPLISIDGPPAVHDRGRPFPDGSGSYQAASAGARRALTRDPDLMARATLSDAGIGYVTVAESLLALGFRRVHITAASPVNPGFGLGRDSFDRLTEPFTAFADWFLEGVLSGRLAGHFFGPLDHLIGDLYRRRVGSYACSAGLTGLYVTPDGDLYPCFRMVRDAYRLGNVLAGDFLPEQRQPFFDAAVDRRPACVPCWARYICRGECSGDNLDENGDMLTPTEGRCRLFRHYVAEAARCLAHLARRAPGLLPKRYPADDAPPRCS
jgi:uncharacterized protein